MPSNAAIDAVHVAIAAAHGVDFLVTWNCTHIANAVAAADGASDRERRG